MRHMLLSAAAVIAASYLILVAAVYVWQGRLIYFPHKNVGRTPADAGLAYEAVRLTASDGIALSAWFIPARDERAVLLFCHGNAGNISHRIESARIYRDLGLSVLLFDYRGYGASTGSPDEEGTYRDARAAWDYLVQERGKRLERIIVFGESLGGAVAAATALRTGAGGLIILSGFTSLSDIGQTLYPFLPVRLLLKYRYATGDTIGAIACPKLIIHSPEDEIVPFPFGRRLFEKAQPPKEFLEIRGGHNDGIAVSGDIYVRGVEAFLNRYF